MMRSSSEISFKGNTIISLHRGTIIFTRAKMSNEDTDFLISRPQESKYLLSTKGDVKLEGSGI